MSDTTYQDLTRENARMRKIMIRHGIDPATGKSFEEKPKHEHSFLSTLAYLVFFIAE